MNSIIDSDGIERFLGNIDPGTDATKYSWAVYGDVPSAPMVARSKWDALIAGTTPGPEYGLLRSVHDQNGYGACNASATALAMEISRARQGLIHVSLSAGDLYGRINGGSDRGSMLEDGLAESMRGGVASTAVCPYLQWQREAAGAREDRLRFRVLEAFICPTFDHCMSAVLCGFSLISGIMWYGNYNPDGDGWLPTRGSGNAGGHAVCGYKPAKRGDMYGIWHQNSWKASWGYQGGKCVFPEPVYAHGRVGGWWCCRAVTDEGGNVPAPRE